MSVTIKDVAKLAGVSTATVSRVINNDPRISGTTREKVMECLVKLDYKMNNIARSLKTSKSHTIGFLCPELANSFFMTIAKGAEEEFGKHGYNLLICSSYESVREETEKIDLLCKKCVDGVILIPATSEGAHYNQLKEKGIPTVIVDRLVNNFTSDAVLVDNFNGSYSAVEYLISQGKRRIGYIGGNLDISSARERDEGYRRALNNYCIPVEEEIIKYGDFHIDGGYQKMRELMENENPPKDIFITNYFMHLGATKYLVEHNSILPGEISITSFDDMDLASVLGFCGVLVSQPMLEIGYKAASMLFERITNEETDFPRIIRLKTELIKKNDLKN